MPEGTFPPYFLLVKNPPKTVFWQKLIKNSKKMQFWAQTEMWYARRVVHAILFAFQNFKKKKRFFKNRIWKIGFWKKLFDMLISKNGFSIFWQAKSMAWTTLRAYHISVWAQNGIFSLFFVTFCQKTVSGGYFGARKHPGHPKNILVLIKNHPGTRMLTKWNILVCLTTLQNRGNFVPKTMFLFILFCKK